MKWSEVGDWIKENAGGGAALVGSLLTGNYAGAIAAGVGMVSSATGSDDPAKVLAKLQADPNTLMRLEEIAAQKEQDIRLHIQEMTRMRLEDDQKQHEQTQLTIRAGDSALDERIRWQRPKFANWSIVALILYSFVTLALKAWIGDDFFDYSLAVLIASPCWAYMGLRTTDRISQNWKESKLPRVK